MAQFDVNSTSVENIISSIKAGEIAIPEIQRPFVWDGTKVRDLMDSLYKGFPVGYIIVWKNPDVRLKEEDFDRWSAAHHSDSGCGRWSAGGGFHL